jgi:rubrerythrin
LSADAIGKRFLKARRRLHGRDAEDPDRGVCGRYDLWEIAMPYTWTCGECGAKLLSAAPDPPHQACPRCGNELPREPDELREEEDEG